MTRAAACASSVSAQKAADRALAEGASAADAVVAAFFALAGELPGALFAPAVLLVAGPGVSGRALDGRACQPGAGAPRPRGFVEGASIPLAARAAVPRSPHAVLLLQASLGRRSLKKNVAAGVAGAREAGASKRADYLDRIGEGGSVGVATAHEAIVRVAGPFASGLVTHEDLESARPTDQPAEALTLTAATGEDVVVHLEPWPAGGAPVGAHGVAAVDARGLLVTLSCFVGASERGGESLWVPEVELAMPLVAEPVRRGKTRVLPGTVFAVPATLAAADSGPELRAAVSCPAGFERARAAAALSARPLEDGLREAFPASAAYVAVATARESRGVVFGGGG
jgi:hypothetical protein